MTTTAIDTQPAPSHRTSQFILVSCLVSGLMGVLLGIGATALMTQDSRTPAVAPSVAESNVARIPMSADAAERRVTGDAAVRLLPSSPDAAERWATVQVGDLPSTADAAERWLSRP